MKQYFEFRDTRYGVGTIVNIPTTLDLYWLRRLPKEKTIRRARFVGGGRFIFEDSNSTITLYESAEHFKGEYEPYIEIISPIHYQEPRASKSSNIFFRTGSGSWDAHNEVCIGFIWYIVIMLLATIFEARVGIWILATIVYFVWKSKK